ncbi:hypothetical protein VJ923_06070 [Adlercreutzia sp. R25]|uniref:Uncharacterized protein n=1 Tax=Adlercreutzia shanghongiae TaxID=3111773 RepID=A0ABU6IXQ4_9ACTN|nr:MULTISPECIES: hypothetical protein [unclassified Adlercreutzia]MEC4272718.1 hypothetical protein [Adlercreutzia sp. R25]MEC4294382.1 hypothetical protein [Adlercreutzia sp. R22]
MGNYPDSTWEGDPAAPWNQGDAPEAWEQNEDDDPRVDMMREEG